MVIVMMIPEGGGGGGMKLGRNTARYSFMVDALVVYSWNGKSRGNLRADTRTIITRKKHTPKKKKNEISKDIHFAICGSI